MQISAIDTHIHCWQPQLVRYSWLDNVLALNRSFLLEELEEQRVASNVDMGVLVQAANSIEDMDWMLATASLHPWIKGVVGWLPLMHPDATGELLETRFAAPGLVKGIRHLIHDEADHRWILQNTVLASLELLAASGLTYDFVGVKLEHLETALQLAERLPELKLVLDHLNQPPSPGTLQFKKWKSLIKELSANGNFFAKISGLGTASGKGESWTAEDIIPAVNFVLEEFGSDRCMCGGDWPVSSLAGSYVKAWAIYREVLDRLLNNEEQEKVLRNNAIRFYSL